jgi:GNAT superfamily N-acetyltransferase
MTIIRGNALIFRDARYEDLPYIVSLLADDPLGARREQLGDPAYARALEAIDADPTTSFIVAEDEGGTLVGCLQLSIKPGLARRGALRAQLESVRVAGSQRNQGLGAALVEDAIKRAQAAGCTLVELASDMTRKDAHRFWERQGFTGSHLGMKRMLD